VILINYISVRLSGLSGFPVVLAFPSVPGRSTCNCFEKKKLKRRSAHNISLRTRNRLLLVLFTELKRHYNNEKTTAKLKTNEPR
jgi:hypothetical protein